MLARAQARLGQLDQAIATARRSYEISKVGLNKARLLTNLGRHPLMARKVPDALETLRAAVALEKQFDTGKGSWLPLAQCDYGVALAFSGRIAEAKALARREPAAGERQRGTRSAVFGVERDRLRPAARARVGRQ